MAAPRRGQPSLSVPLPASPAAAPGLPPISALFLIDFDVKAGYTIVWKQAEPGLELDGRVEYKSLPSGLHTVTNDLIYFVHDGNHAGLSAFVNEPCEEEEARHARMIAVGVLVPLSYGRLGRAWRHAEQLEEIVGTLVKDRKNTHLLEQYWEANKAKKGTEPRRPSLGETPISSPAVTFPPDVPKERKAHKRQRSGSDGASLAPPEHKLSPYHPAWSLSSLLDKFGPLIFPIYRAALLRKRILISCHAPVHEICDFVYDLSILSNIPLSLTDVLPSSSPTQRLRPLFTIGVHDIPFLVEDFEASKRLAEGEIAAAEDEAGSGWIACTTDSILAMKDTLWDMLITIPPDYASSARDKAWPLVECPRGQPIKATQRDLRRFNALRTGLARLAPTSPAPAPASNPAPDSPQSDASAVRLSSSRSNRPVQGAQDDAVDKLIEPLSWAALAYNGFMWWASAGEQLRSEEQEESTRDAALLADLNSTNQASMAMPRPPSRSNTLTDSLTSLSARRGASGEARIELAIIAYFHRLTTQILSELSDIVDSADEAYTDEDDSEDRGANDDDGAEDALVQSDGEEDDVRAVTVDSRSIENMGLDVWSASDAAFLQELVRTYFGRSVRIEGKGVEVCGVRVC